MTGQLFHAHALANELWQISCVPAWRQFQQAVVNVEQVQRRILESYMTANRNTGYGRRFNFAAITCAEAFQESVPITTYEDYLEFIEAVGRGQSNVLCAEPVRMFEITSGSTSASKLIPYTKSLRSEFRRAIAPWIVDLFRHNPDLKGGPAYWSITPLVEGRRATPGGIPIGFEEDSAYLGSSAKRLVEAALAVPNIVKSIQDIEIFRYVTLLFLLRQPGLRLISVWNPTFLGLLLAPLGEWWLALIQDIARGSLSPPGCLAGCLDPGLRQALLERLGPNPRRAGHLASIRPADGEKLDDFSLKAIWPHLGLISCWMDGPSASYANALQARFPSVPFQAKGLIATEACVSFPVVGLGGSVLAVTSHFFEFLPVDGRGQRPKLAHQLEKGQAYSVVVTTGGGLYRYHLRDVVQVVDHLGQAPCLRFLGKGDQVSDWFGEKLDERFVANVLAGLWRKHGLAPVFAMLAPDDSEGRERVRYTLYLELEAESRCLIPGDGLAELALELDRGLCQNFHYDYCRRLGQLAAAKIVWIEQGAVEAYLRACEARGQRLGDIKLSPLQKTSGWSILHDSEAL